MYSCLEVGVREGLALEWIEWVETASYKDSPRLMHIITLSKRTTFCPSNLNICPSWPQKVTK